MINIYIFKITYIFNYLHTYFYKHIIQYISIQIPINTEETNK